MFIIQLFAQCQYFDKLLSRSSQTDSGRSYGFSWEQFRKHWREKKRIDSDSEKLCEMWTPVAVRCAIHCCHDDA